MGFIWSIIIGIVAGLLVVFGVWLCDHALHFDPRYYWRCIGWLGIQLTRHIGRWYLRKLDNLYGRSYFVIMDRLAIQQIQRGLRRRAQLSNHILHGNKISRNFSYGII